MTMKSKEPALGGRPGGRSLSGAGAARCKPLRIRDLPEEERAPFAAWLYGQTCPMIAGVPPEGQDGYYRHDYERWKAGLPVDD